METQVLNGKRVFITGITGFVGTHLARRLEALGSEVFGLSTASGSSKILRADIRERDRIQRFMKERKVQACIHLAAESTVEAGQQDPEATFSVNVQGTVSILEIARAFPLERVIVASTSQVYGAHPVPCDEDSPLRASRPYEVSKSCADMIAQTYADTFGLSVLIPRFVNTYGPGDAHAQRLIPRTIRSVLQGESPTMWGGESQREYLYVGDAVEAYLRLLQVPKVSLGGAVVFNIGTEQPTSVRAVIEKVLTMSGASLPIRRVADERPDEIPFQSVSAARARALLDWKPAVSLDEGIKATLAWHATSQEGAHSVRTLERANRIWPA